MMALFISKQRGNVILKQSCTVVFLKANVHPFLSLKLKKLSSIEHDDNIEPDPVYYVTISILYRDMDNDILSIFKTAVIDAFSHIHF